MSKKYNLDGDRDMAMKCEVDVKVMIIKNEVL